MLRLFRRPSRDTFELDPGTGEAAGDELGPDAEGERLSGRKRRLLTAILASGILAVALCALYLGWSGRPSDEPVPPHLLPPSRPPPGQGPAAAPGGPQPAAAY